MWSTAGIAGWIVAAAVAASGCGGRGAAVRADSAAGASGGAGGTPDLDAAPGGAGVDGGAPNQQDGSADVEPVTFSPAVHYPAGPAATAIAAADLNGDGHADLFVANGEVGVLLNEGPGTFLPPDTLMVSTPVFTDLPFRRQPRSLALADLNGDGHLDVAVANVFAGMRTSGNLAILGSDGGAAWRAPVILGEGMDAHVPLQVLAGDLNGDAKVDLLAAKADGQVNVWLNDGGGGFQSGVDLPGHSNVSTVAVEDVDHDGRRDLLFVDAGTLGVALNDGSGSFAASSSFPTAIDGAVGEKTFLAVGDLNGDDHPDVVLARQFAGMGAGQLVTRMNNGDATFAPAVEISGGLIPGALALGDLNGDGRLDLIVLDLAANRVRVLLNGGGGALAGAGTASSGPNPRSLAVADLNGDGKPDVAVTDDDGVSVLLNAR